MFGSPVGGAGSLLAFNARLSSTRLVSSSYKSALILEAGRVKAVRGVVQSVKRLLTELCNYFQKLLFHHQEAPNKSAPKNAQSAINARNESNIVILRFSEGSTPPPPLYKSRVPFPGNEAVAEDLVKNVFPPAGPATRGSS